MTLESIVFYFFASLMIISAIAVVSLKNSVKAVLSLVLTFFCGAVLWLLLEAEFLAISLVLVYVGAVMVLFLFVVMMLDLENTKSNKNHLKQIIFGVIIAIALFAGLYIALGSQYFGEAVIATPAPHSLEYSNVSELGKLLYTQYFYAFEIAGVILLVAIIAAISLTFRGRLERRGQSVRGQHRVSKEDRLRVVNVKTSASPAEQDKLLDEQAKENDQ